jgi:putative transposase
MARLPRLVIPGLPHVVSLEVQHEQTLARDPQDRLTLLALVRVSAAAQGVAVHAYAIGDDGLDLLVTPGDVDALGRFMQSVARRHAAAFNRRHGRRGGLWAGRYRTAALQPQPWMLRCMRWVEQRPWRWPSVSSTRPLASLESDASSAAHHLGLSSERWLVDPAPYWALGNTPFERELAYQTLLQLPLESAEGQLIAASLRGGWFIGDASYLEKIAPDVDRRASPRSPGRPRSVRHEPN